MKRERYIEEEVKRRTEESTTNAAPTSSAEEELRKQEYGRSIGRGDGIAQGGVAIVYLTWWCVVYLFELHFFHSFDPR